MSDADQLRPPRQPSSNDETIVARLRPEPPGAEPSDPQQETSGAHDETLAIAPASRTASAASGGDSAAARPRSLVSAAVRDLIPGYEILRELGHGGQGVVYLAVQQATKRNVAIKLLLTGPHTSPTVQRRFEREIELAAQLRHPAIVSVLHSGTTTDGRTFYVMDYVDGVPLDRYVQEQQITVRETLALMTQVCEGVQYAHQHGIIHRDLKPSNILVSVDSSTGAAPAVTPRLLDFGLAKLVDAAGQAQTVVSLSQEVVGTLPFMSPEQATGRHELVDTRTDVYALGVVLYVLLTGDYPYPVAGNLMDVLRNISDTAPMAPIAQWRRSPRALRKHLSRQCPIDADAETIILKALAKEPQRRYQSAGELGRDLDHYLRGEPIAARADSSWYLLRKAARRYRGALVAAVMLVMLISASAVWLFLLYREQSRLRQFADDRKDAAERSQREAEDALDLAEERRRQAQWQAYLAGIGAADAALRAGDVRAASARLSEAPQEHHQWEWRYLAGQVDRSAMRRDVGAPVSGVAFIGDGNSFVTVDADGSVQVWSPQRLPGRKLKLETKTAATCACFSPDDARLAVGFADGSIRLVDPVTAKTLSTVTGHTGAVVRVAFDPNGKWLASASRDGAARLWDANAPTESLAVLKGHGSWLTGVAFQPNGQRVLTSGRDGTVRVWEAPPGKEALVFRGHPQPISAFAVSRYGDMVASASWGMIKVWSAATGRESSTLRLTGGDVSAVAISPDGSRVAAGQGDGSVRLLDAGNGLEIAVLRGHRDAVTGLTFSPDFAWLASSSADGTVRLWDCARAERDGLPWRDDRGWTAFAASADGRRLVAAPMVASGEPAHLLVRDEVEHKLLADAVVHDAAILAVGVSPDGSRVATTSEDKSVRVWKLDDLVAAAPAPQPVATLSVAAPAMGLAWSHNGRQLAFGLTDHSVLVWEPDSGAAPRRLEGHTDSVMSAAWTADADMLATASWDGTIRLWRMEDSAVVQQVQAPSGAVECVALAEDEDALVGGGRTESGQGWLRAWGLGNGKPLCEPILVSAPVRTLEVTRDAQRVIWAMDNGTVHVARLSDLQELLVLRGHERPIVGLGLMQDGSKLYSASSDGIVRVWESPTAAQTP